MDLRSNFNYIVYDFLKTHFNIYYQKKSVEKQLLRIETLALFLFKYFSYYLADFDLENRIIKIAKDAFSDFEFPVNNSNENKIILHIATEIYDTGGHTRVIKNWIDKDAENESFLLITKQITELKTNILTEIEQNMSRKTFFLDNSLDYLRKAGDLIDFIVLNQIDTIVLHTHPHDLVPFLSLVHKNAPKTILFNHSDHTFCLGASIVDLVLDLREEGKNFSLKHRAAIESQVVQLPVNIPYKTSEKRKKKTTLLSMASWYKFKPFEGQNFLLSYSKFLEENPEVDMYIIGVDEKVYFNNIQKIIPKNLFLLGIVPNPKEYLMQADYYIESFPVGSILASYDSCIYGAVPIFSFHNVLIYKDALKKMFPAMNYGKEYTNEMEYFEFLKQELKQKTYQTENKEIIAQFLNKECNENWYNTIKAILYTLKVKQKKSNKKNKLLITEQSRKYARFTSCFPYFRFVDYINSRIELLHPLLVIKVLKISFLNILLKK